MVSAALVLLIAGVYIFAISSPTSTQFQMMPTPAPNTSNSNQIISVALIAAAAIALVAAISYFIYSRKPRRENAELEMPDWACSAKNRGDALQTQTEPARPFEAFLCYKKSSGRDYADHLKSGLEEIGVHTFEDCKDIPLTVDTEESWSRFRDKALRESKYFILVMTPGFDLSSEVIKEVGLARKQGGKTFVFFRHRSMGRKIVLNLGDEVLDIGQLEQVSFESKEELLRLSISILYKTLHQ